MKEHRMGRGPIERLLRCGLINTQANILQLSGVPVCVPLCLDVVPQ